MNLICQACKAENASSNDYCFACGSQLQRPIFSRLPLGKIAASTVVGLAGLFMAWGLWFTGSLNVGLASAVAYAVGYAILSFVALVMMDRLRRRP